MFLAKMKIYPCLYLTPYPPKETQAGVNSYAGVLFLGENEKANSIL